MKIFKYFAFILLISLIFTISPAMAQETDPPDEGPLPEGGEALDMSQLEALGIDVKFDMENPPEGAITYEAAPPAAEESKDDWTADTSAFDEPMQPTVSAADLAAMPDIAASDKPFAAEGGEPLDLSSKDAAPPRGGGDRVVYPDTGNFPVAWTTSDEESPAIAHGDSHYVVVYLRGGDIWAVAYDNDGNVDGFGRIYDGANACSELSIAYEPNTKLFVIAFRYYWSSTDWDVRAITFHPAVGQVGGTTWVSGLGGVDEESPSVACNPRVGHCLVAYEYNDGTQRPVHGNFVAVNNSGIFSVSPRKQLTNVTGSYNPILTWGNNTGTFLLVYEWYDGGINEWDPVYNHLLDVYTTGNQYLYNGIYLVPIGWDTRDGYDKLPLGATYDPCTQRYLVIFYHEFSKSPLDKDIYFTFLRNSTWGTTGRWAFANTGDNEYEGDIQFATDDHVPSICGLTDQMVVTYKNAQDGVYASNIWANSNPTNPIYYWNTEPSHLLIAPDLTGLTGYDPVISSGDHGRMFITWEWDFSGDEDVWGNMIRVFWRQFTPLLSK